jgi:hypothetical protein
VELAADMNVLCRADPRVTSLRVVSLPARVGFAVGRVHYDAMSSVVATSWVISARGESVGSASMRAMEPSER